jgi:inosine-uridine nucleoside N-ribohydrolase
MKHRYRITILLLATSILMAAALTATERIFADKPMMKVIIDTDAGVDDAMAIAWLLSQNRQAVDVLGITAVAGNTTVDNVANNVLIVLGLVGRNDIPVLIGADAPLQQAPSSTGAMVHGPDGLWFYGYAFPQDIGNLSHDVTDFYCQNAAPEVTLVMLGPLTNLANALAHCPQAVSEFGQIVVLGGANGAGNRTAVAEFNIWYDPEAAAQVLNAGLNLALMPLNTFNHFSLEQEEIDELVDEGNAAGKFLAGPLQMYANIQTGFSDQTRFTIPDVPAVMVALNPSLGSSQSALVKVVAPVSNEGDSWLLRGQTLIGLEFTDRIPLIADDQELSELAQRAFTEPGFNLEWELFLILMREPDNAHLITSVDSRAMQRHFMRDLTR